MQEVSYLKILIKRLSKKYFIYEVSSKNIKNKKDIKYINYPDQNLSIFKNPKIESYSYHCHGKISSDHNYDDVLNDHYSFTQIFINNINKKFLKKLFILELLMTHRNNLSGKDKLIKEKPGINYGQKINFFDKVDYGVPKK